MMSSRFLKFLLVALVLTVAVSQDAGATAEASATTDEGCATPGECANPDALAAEEEPVKIEEDPSCPSRPHIIRCTAKYMDLNQNGKLDRDELEGAINSLPWLARGVLKIIGSVNTIMTKCDYDGDGAISIDYDMQHNADTCLTSCFKRRAFKRAFFSDCDL